MTFQACIQFDCRDSAVLLDVSRLPNDSVIFPPVFAADKWMVEVRKFEERIPTKLTVYAAGADMGRNSTFRKSLFESKDFSNILGKKTILQAGYALPEIHVFALSLNGAPINEVPDSRSDKKTKLKILRKVTKLTDDAHARDTGTDGRIGKGLGSVLTDVSVSRSARRHTLFLFFFPRFDKIRFGTWAFSTSVDNVRKPER